MSNWKANISVSKTSSPAPFAAPVPSADELIAAAKRFADRTDPFANGKELTCRDLAAKLNRFGSYASDKQRDFAAKLVEWSKPRQAVRVEPAPVNNKLPVPRLFSIMQRLADLYIGDIKIARRNQDSFCWVTLHNLVVGKIENGTLTVFPARCKQANNTRPERVVELVEAIEANPLEAAKAAGRASGRCSCCGRDLTDEGSIEMGIGPICLSKIA